MPSDTPVRPRKKTCAGDKCLQAGHAISANWNRVHLRAPELLLQDARLILFPSTNPPLLLQNLRPAFLLRQTLCGYCRSDTRTLRVTGDPSEEGLQLGARARHYIVHTFLPRKTRLRSQPRFSAQRREARMTFALGAHCGRELIGLPGSRQKSGVFPKHGRVQ